MYIVDILESSIRNLKNRKKATVINITLLSLSLIIVLVSQVAYNAISSFSGLFNDGPRGRSVVVSKNGEYEDLGAEIEKCIGDDKNVEYIGRHYDLQMLKVAEEQSGVEWSSMDFICSNPAYDKYITEGKESSDLGKYEVYIPKFINTESSNEINIFDEIIDYKDGEKYIGKTIKVTCGITDYATGEIVGDYKAEVTVAGVYDNIAVGEIANVTVLASPEFIKEIKEAKVTCSDTESMFYEDYLEYISKEEYVIVADRYKHLQGIRDKLKKGIGDNANALMELSDSVSMVENIVSAIRFAGIFMTLVAAINMAFSQMKDVAKRRREFALLKAIGYRNKYIRSILITELFIISAVAIAACLLVYIAVYIPLHSIISGMDLLFQRVQYGIGPLMWLAAVAVIALAMTAVSLFGERKARQISASEALKTG